MSRHSLFISALLALGVNSAWAAPLAIAPVLPISLGLGARQTVELTVSGASGEVELAVDESPLREKDPERDVRVELAPKRLSLPGRATLTIETRASSPSFLGGRFAVKARSATETAALEVAVTVEPRYVVRILQRREGLCEANKRVTDSRSWVCDFDSPAETVYFRPHAAGLTVEFRNETQDRFFVHGSGAIPHMMEALLPGKSYAPVIAGEPADLKGSYTFHEIYRPSRDAVFNATRIPRP
jgi:hypothetical protein